MRSSGAPAMLEHMATGDRRRRTRRVAGSGRVARTDAESRAQRRVVQDNRRALALIWTYVLGTIVFGVLGWLLVSRLRSSRLHLETQPPSAQRAYQVFAVALEEPDRALGQVVAIVALIATVAIALGALSHQGRTPREDLMFDNWRDMVTGGCVGLAVYAVALAAGQVATRSSTMLPAAPLALFAVVLAAPLHMVAGSSSQRAYAARLSRRAADLEKGLTARRHVPTDAPLGVSWARFHWSLVRAYAVAVVVSCGAASGLALLPGADFPWPLLVASSLFTPAPALVFLAAWPRLTELWYARGERTSYRFVLAVPILIVGAHVFAETRLVVVSGQEVGSVVTSAQLLVAELGSFAVIAVILWRGRRGNGLGHLWWDRALMSADEELVDLRRRMREALEAAKAPRS